MGTKTIQDLEKVKELKVAHNDKHLKLSIYNSKVTKRKVSENGPNTLLSNHFEKASYNVCNNKFKNELPNLKKISLVSIS